MMKSVLCILFAGLVSAVYNPNAGDDWTLLKPEAESLEGSYDSVPFAFGIVVNPYVVNQEGGFEPPEHSSVPREILTTKVTTYLTSYVTAAPKPTKSVDVYQIQDGQIQKIPRTLVTSIVESETSTDCDEEEEEVEEEFLEKREDSEDCGDEDDEDDDESFVSPVYAVSCATEDTLQMTLEDGVLRDVNDRLGCIVGGHQFQFDGPVPQYGTLYAGGWSITDKGQLSLGNSTKFYQCASGDFYNLYDQPVGLQCNPVTLDVVELIEC